MTLSSETRVRTMRHGNIRYDVECRTGDPEFTGLVRVSVNPDQWDKMSDAQREAHVKLKAIALAYDFTGEKVTPVAIKLLEWDEE